jgi:HSP90 family molecular chaperone
MIEPKTNQEFYRDIDATCLRLREIGMGMEANRISHLLHKVAWTSTSELFEKLEETFEELLAGAHAARLTQQLKEELTSYVKILANV